MTVSLFLFLFFPLLHSLIDLYLAFFTLWLLFCPPPPLLWMILRYFFLFFFGFFFWFLTNCISEPSFNT